DHVPSLERGLHLQADEVVGVLEPAGAAGVGDRRPLRANNGQQHVAGVERFVDALREVLSRLDGADVHEDRALAEVAGKRVVQAAGITGRVLPSIADEDAAHGLYWASVWSRFTRSS